MKNDSKALINQAINASVASANARRVIRWVMDCELNDFNVINPSNAYFAKKFGWNTGTVRKAVSQAKRSGFVDVIGYGKGRTFELNRKRLQEAVTQFVGRRQRKKPLDLCEIVEKGNTESNTEGNTLGNTKGNTEGNTKTPNNRGKSPSNNNRNKKCSSSSNDYHTLVLPKIRKFQRSCYLNVAASAAIADQLLEAVSDYYNNEVPPEKCEIYAMNYVDYMIDNVNELGLKYDKGKSQDFILVDKFFEVKDLLALREKL